MNGRNADIAAVELPEWPLESGKVLKLTVGPGNLDLQLQQFRVLTLEGVGRQKN